MSPLSLPPEVWHLILSQLSLEDLNTVMLVSKDMAALASKDWMLWKDVKLSRQKLVSRDVEQELAMIKMDRFSRKKRLDIKDYINDSLSNAEYQAQCILHSLVQYSCTVEHVEELSLEDADLLNIETSLLAACVDKLERLNLRYCKVRREDILAIVSTIPSSTNMKSINLSCMDLSCLSPHLLKEAAASLEELSLNYSNLSTEQCEGVVSGVRDRIS